MKPLDVTKVLMGIQSSRENVRRFQNNASVWAKRTEYSYEDILKLATLTVQEYYVEQLAGLGITTKTGSYKRAIN